MKPALNFVLLLFLAATASAQTDGEVYFAPDPGPVQVRVYSFRFVLGNKALQQAWSVRNGSFRELELHDGLAQRDLPAQLDAFVLIVRDAAPIASSKMHAVARPSVKDLPADPKASRLSERLPGKAVEVELEDVNGTVHATWRAVLRDGSNYLRQEVTFRAVGKDLPIAEVRLLDWDMPDAHVVGSVRGSPVVGGNFFAGFEHPLSSCTVSLGRARCQLERDLPLRAEHSVTYSSVIGIAPAGQMRRAFLRYVERERAHPYRTFLHYNSWYDLGYFNRYDESGALDVVNAFGRELQQKRGVTLSSYLFDDGWDDPKTLWHFNPGFPDGFTKVRKAAEQFGAEPGVWMSPWGGYGKPRQERVERGRKEGYEIVDNGFALSGPKYYKLFHDTCLEMMTKYGVNQFKFDGTGNANRVVPGSEFDSDFDAAINLIGELRHEKPDLYVNLTTGTYPSPFWLRYADSIWRGGEDHDFTGVGTSRERWITYRDADTYEHVVSDGPLYPLNSLMLHGLIYAKQAKNLQNDPGGDFRNEVRSYFGNGTQLQEMYITPSLLSPADWDNLAEAANWSRANAAVLVDTHWVGGDPAQLEVYGWASWTPKKAILVLRNPSDRPQGIALDAAKVFELPAGASQQYQLKSPWKEEAAQEPIVIRAGEPHSFQLKPFAVLVFDAVPQ